MNFRKNLILMAIVFLPIFLSGCGGAITETNEATETQTQVNQTIEKADRIEVVHFHATKQCWSCITVGEYALKTIKERFPDEYASGKIVFYDINGELEENMATVIKYQAGGSSLFINAITGDKENIQEEIRVWRLVGDEKLYKDYLEARLRDLLG